MIIKKQLKLSLEQFLEQFSLEELIDKLILLDKIERGKIQSENNKLSMRKNLKMKCENGSSKMDNTFCFIPQRNL